MMKLLIPKSAESHEPIDNEVMNRTMLAVGEDAVKRLSRLHVGIVGLGGIGIVAAELVARLGVKKITVIDFDKLSCSNLNRFLGATRLDAKLETPKVNIAARIVWNINPDVEFTIVNDDFLQEKNQKKFKSCDFIFGCSDSVGVRIAANHLCVACGIIYIDLGCGVKIENGKMVACGGQVVKVIPGNDYCINCSELFDLGKVSLEFTDPEEAARQRAMGYVEGANVPQPSVYALNMTISSLAVWMMMRLVAGEDLEFDGIYYDAMSLQTYTWLEKRLRGRSDCVVCGKNGVEFQGDEVELLVRERIEESSIPLNNPDNQNHRSSITEVRQEGTESVVQHQRSESEQPEQNSGNCRGSRHRGGWDLRVMLEDAMPKTF